MEIIEPAARAASASALRAVALVEIIETAARAIPTYFETKYFRERYDFYLTFGGEKSILKKVRDKKSLTAFHPGGFMKKHSLTSCMGGGY